MSWPWVALATGVGVGIGAWLVVRGARALERRVFAAIDRIELPEFLPEEEAVMPLTPRTEPSPIGYTARCDRCGQRAQYTVLLTTNGHGLNLCRDHGRAHYVALVCAGAIILNLDTLRSKVLA